MGRENVFSEQEVWPMKRDLSLLVMQFLYEHGFTETAHKLEQESGFYFNMMYFEEEVSNGNWNEVNNYISGFTKVDDNEYSTKIFFEIHKQRYLEALDKHDVTKATEILTKDLKVFASFNEDIYKELTELLTLENFREHKKLANYPDSTSMKVREAMLAELKRLIVTNPLLHDKLQFPTIMNSRLVALVNQSLHMQHKTCMYPKPYLEVKTLFVDHNCGIPLGAQNGNDKGYVDAIPNLDDKSKLDDTRN